MQHLRSFPLARLTADSPVLAPTDALRRMVGELRPVLLDGACDADGLGRYSYAACNPRARYVVATVDPAAKSCRASLDFASWLGDGEHANPVQAPCADIWRALHERIDSWHPLVAVGLLDYELGRHVEHLPSRAAASDVGTPAIDFAAYDALYRFDATLQKADLVAVDEDAAERLRAVLRRPPDPLSALRCGSLASDMSQAQHAAAVARIVEHLRAGDCYQVNLCRWLRAPLSVDGVLPAYLALRAVAPAPLGAFLRLDGAVPDPGAPTVLSNSPELFLGIDFQTARVETRPIKGTRRRGGDAVQDLALRAELLASRKDAAEHVMIVDLLRNDLGRVALPGSVQVDGFQRCVSLPTVHHLVSTVTARLAPGIGLGELLHATFPGGSITGAPKVSAMRIIDSLEPRRRGPFYGAIGWLARDGGSLALCIRTAIAYQNELVLAVGGGIVLDSTPDEEWAETEAKAAAFSRALSPAVQRV